MNIPRDLLDEAVRVSGAASLTTAVIMGLEELIRRKRMEHLLKLRASDAVLLTPREQRRQRQR